MDSRIVEKLEEKISDGNQMLEEIKSISHSSYSSRHDAFQNLRRTYGRWFYTTKTLLGKLEISQKDVIEEFSGYGREVKTLSQSSDQRSGEKIRTDVQHQVSLLESVLEIYREIDPIDVRTAVEKGVYEDELDQARGLLEGNHVVPSVSVMRIVLKNSLESLCEKKDIEPDGNINNLLIQLKEKGVISKIEFREMQKWNDIANATRYDDEDVSKSEIDDTIDKVEDFTGRLELQ